VKPGERGDEPYSLSIKTHKIPKTTHSNRDTLPRRTSSKKWR
jgi:hypothetical protein